MKITLNPFRAVCTTPEAYDASDNCDGICTVCGSIAEGECEPDATNYVCSDCGANMVFGFEHLVLMGQVTII